MTTSLLTQEMRRTYAAQRGVSQGAHITLAAVSGGWQARFECAQRAAGILGDRNLENNILHIPMQDAHSSITKLAESFSVALVDTVTDEQGSRFVLVWKIAPTRLPIPEGADFGNTVILTPKEGPAVVVTVPTGDELDEY